MSTRFAQPEDLSTVTEGRAPATGEVQQELTSPVACQSDEIRAAALILLAQLAAEFPDQKVLLDGQNPLVAALVSRVVATRSELERLQAQLADVHTTAEQRAQTITTLQDMATKDPLTGLLNVRGLEEALKRLSAGHERRTVTLRKLQDSPRDALEQLLATPYAALGLDIDHFKTVNDTYGHPAGNMVLKELARRLAERIRGDDILARNGGEEFVVIALAANGGAAILAEDLRELVEARPFDIINNDGQPQQINVTVSIGIAPHLENGDNEDMLRNADAALYAAKKAGRNQVWVFDAQKNEPVKASQEKSKPSGN